MFALLAAVAPTTAVYAPAEGLRMDLYRPQGRGPFPAVVAIHGGSYLAGDRTMLAPEAQALARAGFVAASIDYRLAPRAHVDEMVDEARTAVRYLRAHARALAIDPGRIGAFGHSAGGQLALMLGVPAAPKAGAAWPGVSGRVGAVVSFAGPTDFTLPFPAYDLDRMAPALFGRPYAQAGPAMRALSPVSYAGRNFPPTYFIQGTKDPYVPYAQSVVMRERLQAAGVPTVLRAMKGGGHFADYKDPAWNAALAGGVEFLRANLR